ncbi:MAG TPA: RNA polymerase sigma factor [Polyangiaceae bacterium]
MPHPPVSLSGASISDATTVPVFSDNRELLQRFRRGERDALGFVYRAYFDDLYRLARFGFSSRGGARVAGLERDADRLDFVQDVFLRAFAEPARLAYDGLRPYRPFLLQIARNLRVDQLRYEARRAGLGEPALELDVEELAAQLDEAPAVEADLYWERLVLETARVVDSLGSDLQQLARLRFMDELSQAAAAERLGVTRRRVRTLENRLVASVRRALAKAQLLKEKI